MSKVQMWASRPPRIQKAHKGSLCCLCQEAITQKDGGCILNIAALADSSPVFHKKCMIDELRLFA